MSHGKKICRILKEIRQQIAEKNDIALLIAECHFQGECKGTCPKCEAEVRYLEKELNKRRQLGKAVAVTGISLGMAGAFAGCGTPTQNNMQLPEQNELAEITEVADSMADTLPSPIIIKLDGYTPPMLVGVLGGIGNEFPDTFDRKKQSDELNFGLDKIVYKNELFEKRPKCETDEDKIYHVVGEIGAMAEYPGGIEKLHKFIADNLVYPKDAIENGIEGKVLIEITIGKDGIISNVKVLHDIGYGCGEEVVRVVKMMPKWKPGERRGENVESTYQLPISFTFDNK